MADQPVLSPTPAQAVVAAEYPSVTEALFQSRPVLSPVNIAAGGGLTTGRPVGG